MKKKTIDPQFHEDVVFNVPASVPLLECIIRVSVWHQSLLADDTFLGQVSMSYHTCQHLLLSFLPGQPVSCRDD